jgi:IS1 family transposase/transposase-like protein
LKKPQDWGQPCPNRECGHYTLMNCGNVSAISTYMTESGNRRIFRCKVCGKSFSETRGTVFFDLRTPEEKVMMALKMLLVRVELSGIGFVLGVTEETVLEWLRRAARKAEEINRHLLRELPVTEVQLDEMWNFIKRKRSQQPGDGPEATPDSEDGRQWIWISFAPEFRLMLSCVVGPRTSESALALIRMTAQVVAGIPCFFSDGFSAYLPALMAVYHEIKAFAPTSRKGRPRKPTLEVHPYLVYAQVVKKTHKGKLVTLTERVVCGADRLKALGLRISTSLIERLNLTLRHALSPLTRKSLGFCKDRKQMRRRMTFFQAFYNVARPHQTLRLPLPEAEQIHTGIIHPKWIPRTPGMAAGITDHVWSFRELLTIKFGPIQNQSISG